MVVSVGDLPGRADVVPDAQLGKGTVEEVVGPAVGIAGVVDAEMGALSGRRNVAGERRDVEGPDGMTVQIQRGVARPVDGNGGVMPPARRQRGTDIIDGAAVRPVIEGETQLPGSIVDAQDEACRIAGQVAGVDEGPYISGGAMGVRLEPRFDREIGGTEIDGAVG